MRRLLVIMAALFHILAVQAVEPADSARSTSHALSFGIGTSSVLDTYLSPVEYSGISARVLRETLRKTHLMDGRIYVQSMLHIQGSIARNPSQTGKMYSGLVTWNMSWLLRLRQSQRLRFLIGGGSSLEGGAIYNRRNSNNPANAKASAAIQATGIMLYDFQLAGRSMLLKCQAAAPLIGVMFTPEFGQSYYQMFTLGQKGHNIALATPFDRPSACLSASVDIPFGHNVIRAGYLADISQMRIHDLRSHLWSHSIMIGYEKTFSLERGRKGSPLR